MVTDFWNNFWMVVVGSLSLSTSIVAIKIANKANKQVEKQIVLSNKQSLLDLRVECYKCIEESLILYKNLEVDFKKINEQEATIKIEIIQKVYRRLILGTRYESELNYITDNIPLYRLDGNAFKQKILDFEKNFKLIPIIFNKSKYEDLEIFLLDLINLLNQIVEWNKWYNEYMQDKSDAISFTVIKAGTLILKSKIDNTGLSYSKIDSDLINKDLINDMSLIAD
ncbi:hypothetical protein [Lactococcus lactis]|uniref:hypothetical protein n=1 Tax=Lactococcus lactis TaxID=1358 RepID=UPI0022E4F8F9|nr:hypothetical protein [Lactococcus lactis]